MPGSAPTQTTVTHEWDERECATCRHAERHHESGECRVYYVLHEECPSCACDERCGCSGFTDSGRVIHYESEVRRAD